MGTTLSLLAAALILPLFGFSAYLWSIGGRSARGRLMKIIAVLLAVAAIVLLALFWRLESLLAP